MYTCFPAAELDAFCALINSTTQISLPYLKYETDLMQTTALVSVYNMKKIVILVYKNTRENPMTGSAFGKSGYSS